MDTDLNKIPASSIKSSHKACYEFNQTIIEATKDSAAAYKINFAFYESDGVKGICRILKKH
ncbi:MAG: hypothetical protein MZV64_47450 [Ignavibacteriales bacterium]|nr:hypothetical protein [Ignavibacteriales bacterium]